MEKKSALLIDTVSIQQYIFSSNKLKENIGASYIVEKLLFDFSEFISIPFEEGYTGGGNALVFFENDTERKKFKKLYSRKVLASFPGIRLAFGELDNFEKDIGFKKSKSELTESLINNKSAQHLEIMPFKHGIVNDCPYSNEGQEIKYMDNFISTMTAIKLAASIKSNVSINEKYSGIIGNYTFTTETDKLGQPDEKGYIAIVHADGNGIGKRFLDCESLEELKKLSKNVSGISGGVLDALVTYIVNDIMPKMNKENGFIIKKENNKQILPFRQILAGGDDITFVCEGKLGMPLAIKILELMNNPPKEKGIDKWMKVDACAGVAIVHTKSPFYLGYKLASELCDKAKKESRDETGPNVNRLAFLISSGGVSGDLESIIKQNYSTPTGNLYYGSYSFGINKPIKSLIEGVKHFKNEKAISKNKVFALRDTLKQNKASQDYFLVELKASNNQLPNNAKTLWENKETPLYDMIDLMDFYPTFLLPNNQTNETI